MKTRAALGVFLCAWFATLVLFPGVSHAQTKAYRQTNLASNVPGAAANTVPSLTHPGAVAFLPGEPFFVVDAGSGKISTLSVTGAEAGSSAPVSVAAKAGGAAPLQYVVATRDGTIRGFSAVNGKISAAESFARDDSFSGALYTAAVLLHPNCCASFVAAADFHGGSIRTFTSQLDALSGAASFTDSQLPPGYAPYGIQIVNGQVYVTYALQNAAKNGPVAGAGNGLVDVFDQEGNFVRRFATAGMLNAPWGVAVAGLSFGPFGGAILVGNSGDGTINAFDSNGNFLGQLKDGDGKLLVNPGVHALAFRSDGGADPNTLFFTAETSKGEGGLFGAISAGLVSVTRASLNATMGDSRATITATVAAGPGNSGTPTGTVTFTVGGVAVGTAPVTDGAATFTLPAMKTAHSFDARYMGDANFLPSTSATVTPDSTSSPDFTVAANPTSVTIARGGSAPVSLTVTPTGTFMGTVSFSCSSVPSITCTFNPATVSTANGAASTSASINVAATSPPYGYVRIGLLPAHCLGEGPFSAGLIAVGGFAFGFALLMLRLAGIAKWESFPRLRAPALAVAGILIVSALSLVMSGCGYGYGSSYTPPPQNSPPATVTVTAQSGSISHTATISVTVQ